MASEPSKITLSRQEVSSLPGSVWVRTWSDQGGVPEWFAHGLENARPVLGLGVVEPLELRLSEHRLVTVSTGKGKTLAEELAGRKNCFDEEIACGLVEQLCFAVARIHDQGREFFAWDSDEGTGPVLSSSLHAVVRKSLHPDPEQRFQSMVEFARALNSESQLQRFDFDGARKDKKLAEAAFLDRRSVDAADHWSDALRKDWLDLAVCNNLAVAKMGQGQWQEAIVDLERAQDLYLYHPLVDCNLGLCYRQSQV